MAHEVPKPDKINALSLEILATFASAARRHGCVTSNEAIAAMIVVIGDVINTLECPDCRRQAVEIVEKLLTVTVAQAQRRFASRPYTH